jgi:hypothetical protein
MAELSESVSECTVAALHPLQLHTSTLPSLPLIDALCRSFLLIEEARLTAFELVCVRVVWGWVGEGMLQPRHMRSAASLARLLVPHTRTHMSNLASCRTACHPHLTTSIHRKANHAACPPSLAISILPPHPPIPARSHWSATRRLTP